jgi:hypothetical protein
MMQHWSSSVFMMCGSPQRSQYRVILGHADGTDNDFVGSPTGPLASFGPVTSSGRCDGMTAGSECSLADRANVVTAAFAYFARWGPW